MTIAVPRHIQPMPPPSLTVQGRFKKFIDERFHGKLGIRFGRRGKLAYLPPGRQDADQIDIDSTCQKSGSGNRDRMKIGLGSSRRNEKINRMEHRIALFGNRMESGHIGTLNSLPSPMASLRGIPIEFRPVLAVCVYAITSRRSRLWPWHSHLHPFCQRFDTSPVQLAIRWHLARLVLYRRNQQTLRRLA